MRRLRVHGAKPKYHHALVGGNFRLDTVQAAALLVKLPHLEAWHAARRQRAAIYDQALAGIATTPPLAWGREHHVYNQYVIRVARDRERVRAELAAGGVASAIFYPVPFHLQECFRPLGHARGDFPRAEEAADTSLALPIYPELTAEQQAHVVALLRQACSG